MVDVLDQDQDGSGVPDGWAPDGLLAGVPDMNAAAARSTLPAVMTPAQMRDIDWGGTPPMHGDEVFSPFVTSSEGGDANAVTQDLDSLDPRLSPVLGQMHWVAVPNSIDQDNAANIDPNKKPDGYPKEGYGSDLTYGDLGGAYDPGTKDVILATDGGHVDDGSYNTVFHETGHGRDALNPNAVQSDQPAFMDAYNSDTPQMTPGEDDYYLNPKGGRSEAYAESFARYFGGDPTLQQDWPNMYNYWAQQYPNVSPGQPWKWSEQ